MNRASIFAVLVGSVVVALFVFVPHLKSRIVNTGVPVPQPLLQLTYITVPARGEACMDQVAVEPGSQVALFFAQTPDGRPGTALRFTMRGDSYAQRYDVPAGWAAEQLEVPFEGPRRSLLATVCIRNPGDRDILIKGTNEGRTLSRPHLTINGKPTPTEGEFSLAFISANGISKFKLVDTIARRMSAFKPVWVQPAFIVALLAVVFFGAFVVPLLVLWRAFALDQQEAQPAGDR